MIYAVTQTTADPLGTNAAASFYGFLGVAIALSFASNRLVYF
jgi:hypothetical protein